MNKTQMDEQMNQVMERANRRALEQFHQQQLALFKQEEMQKKQTRDIEVPSAEIPRRTADTMT